MIAGDPRAIATGVSTDTRAVGAGDAFVALVGDRFDAHDFLGEAAAKGAACAIAQRAPEDLACGFIRVPETLAALQRLAAGYRDSLKDFRAIGITGSSGKTSTKDLVRAVIEAHCPASATQGNLNNHIGLPLTILRAKPEHRAGIWEMGMNHPGEIAPLAAIAKPDLAIITNIGVAHLEHMKTRDAIALEKGMLAEAVGQSGAVILQNEDDYTDAIARRCRARVVRAGLAGGDVTASDLRVSADGIAFTLHMDGASAGVSLPVHGRHMVANALLAAAAGREFGMSAQAIAAALGKAQLTGGRLGKSVIGGVTYLDDTYNANPASMRAALETLAQIPCGGRRIAVLGFMGELGDQAAAMHRGVGEATAAAKIDAVFTVGDLASPIAEGARDGGVPQVEEFSSRMRLRRAVGRDRRGGDLALAKGSRA
ncbi:MAG: UDP-N-acetylmuramoyl-tripeptide--D-alanyl-D-alanine ligase [Verrucomicrobiales bacterium]